MRDGKRLVIVLFASLLAVSLRGGDDLRVTPPREGPEPVAAAGASLELAAASAKDLAWAEQSLLGGDGGGADVSDLLVIQTWYLDSACPPIEVCPQSCNVVTLFWTETVFNSAGVEIFADGRFLGIVPGVPQAALPAVNGVNIFQVPEGRITFVVEDPASGISSDGSIVALDSQPLSDPQDVQCRQGNVGDAGCEVIVTWSFSEPSPTYVIISSGSAGAQLGPEIDTAIFAGAPPGEFCAQVVGFLENADGTYRSCIVESCCDLTCQPPADEFFIRGICNGTGAAPTIASPIFTLNHLFLGGEPPPCREACDCNGDGDLNLSDAVCGLNFLFLGGAPPMGWGGQDPVCEQVEPGDDCETPNVSCPL